MIGVFSMKFISLKLGSEEFNLEQLEEADEFLAKDMFFADLRHAMKERLVCTLINDEEERINFSLYQNENKVSRGGLCFVAPIRESGKRKEKNGDRWLTVHEFWGERSDVSLVFFVNEKSSQVKIKVQKIKK